MPRGAGVRSKRARLMIWKNKLDVWHMTLWIPFHGSWNLAVDVRKNTFDRKAAQIAKAFPEFEIEYVDEVPCR